MPALASPATAAPAATCPTEEIYNTVIHSANSMLLYQQLEECVVLCQKFALIAKNNVEDPNSVAARDRLMVVGIQALAEMNRWPEVMPFVCQVYDGLEETPGVVAKLCMKLHLKLDDRSTCGVIGGIWLRHQPNMSKPEYAEVLDLYIDEVLVPAGSWDLIKPILDAHPSLDPAAREVKWRKIQAIQRKQQLKSADEIEVLESSSMESVRGNEQQPDGMGSLPGTLSVYIRTVTEFFQRYLPPHTYLFMLRNICIVCLLLYILVRRLRSGILPDSFLGRILEQLQKLWKGMFAPFYKSRR